MMHVPTDDIVALIGARALQAVDAHWPNRAIAGADLGLQNHTFDSWSRGRRCPSVGSVVDICRQTGESADWILGLSEERVKRPRQERIVVAAAPMPSAAIIIDPAPSKKEIVAACAIAFGATVSDIVGGRRLGYMVDARHAAAWLMRQLLAMSYKAIGAYLGGRDHSTVVHMMENVQSWHETGDARLRGLSSAITALADGHLRKAVHES